MAEALKSKAIHRALTTVNAPLPRHVDGATLLACLRLAVTDRRWHAHVRSFFADVGMDVLMDLAVEGALTFEDMAKALAFWQVDEDLDNARWIRDMAPFGMADPHGVDARGHRQPRER